MMDTAGYRTNLPVEAARIEPRGYYLGLSFHPAVKLERKAGFEFAAALADYIDPKTVAIEDHQWVFSQPISGSPRSSLRIVVLANQVQIAADFPEASKEWFETRQVALLKTFGERFAPELILGSAAMIRGTLAIDGDARIFLARHVMNIGEKPLEPLGRPIHVIGLRLVFPPFRVASDGGEQVTDWLVDVKAESLAEDPSKLYLEADAKWQKPMQWSEENLELVVGRQDEVSQYLAKNVADFLRQAAQANGEEE